MTREEPELLTDSRDFAILFFVILRHKSSEWLESDLQFMELWLSHLRFSFLQTLFLV